jgi:hypothetical protein
MKDKILPCPFCGGSCEVQEALGYFKIRGSHERGCLFDYYEPKVFDSKVEAIAVWNTRAPDLRIAALEAERDAMREALKDMASRAHAHLAKGETHD